MNILTFILCVLGLWISIYFTGVYFKWFPPNVFWIPQVCQLKEETCVTVLQTPRAKLGGIPNSVFGIALYTYLILDLFLFPPLWGFIFLGLALARSIYLAYSLLFITKIPCPLCFAGHLINLSLFLIQWTRFF